MDADEPRAKTTKMITPGEDISPLSVDELEQRIALYQAEIIRLKMAIDSKTASKQAADSVFRM